MQAKQQVGPLQTNEVANIRRKTAAFDVEQYSFREGFRKRLQWNVYERLKTQFLIEGNEVFWELNQSCAGQTVWKALSI